VYAERLGRALQARGLTVEFAAHTRATGPLPDNVHAVRSEQDLGRLLGWREFDVVHDLRLHGVFYRRNPLPVLRYVGMLRGMNPALVVTCGAGHFAEDIRKGAFWRRWLLRLALRVPYHFWSKNMELLEELHRLGLEPRRGSYLSSALPLGELPPLNGEVADFAAKHKPLIVATGWLYRPIYRLDMVIRSVARLRSEFPNVGLILGVSPPPDPQGLRDVETATEETGMGDRILHIRDYDRFPSLLAAADASVRASVVEGSSNALLESLLVGCPAVATDLPNRPAGAILFPRDDEGALVEVLGDILRDPPARTPDPGATAEADANLECICRTYAQAAGRAE
jgi:glycosyltransferase involved in cell wall biosynthesis